MSQKEMKDYVSDVLKQMPSDWLKLTTHRLDIYNEEQAKTQFLDEFSALFNLKDATPSALAELPTAYDYIRLGHPLSCILEWMVANSNGLTSEAVISFASDTAPILAILRKNLFDNRNTQILYTTELPEEFDAELLREIYGYRIELKKIDSVNEVPNFDGSSVFISNQNKLGNLDPKADLRENIDFYLSSYPKLGSVLMVNGEKNHQYIPEIQHVRRRETVAMTPVNCLAFLNVLTENYSPSPEAKNSTEHKTNVLETIKEITGTSSAPLVGSSGLSIQYAIMMGLVHSAQVNHPGKAVKFLVPPNCYGGTNDQARRVAACLSHVEVLDLPVDGDNDMVSSIERVLEETALADAVPYIIAEIPTNPRVEVPDLDLLKSALSKKRLTAAGHEAISPVFVLDQTFCPNVLFLGEGKFLSSVKAISYSSGSKFPSGGLCNAGYCVANEKAESLMKFIGIHLTLCDNEATELQYEILSNQLPSMNERIEGAHQNTREFVNYVHEILPEAKINFVSEELAAQGFTPSVFSLDLPTKGATEQEREAYKRDLNHQLIHLMITEIPEESKYCVSYGQLKGCYWTIPATSTQGTTKEGDKDYIARVALSAQMDLNRHKEVFARFVESIN